MTDLRPLYELAHDLASGADCDPRALMARRRRAAATCAALVAFPDARSVEQLDARIRGRLGASPALAGALPGHVSWERVPATDPASVAVGALYESLGSIANAKVDIAGLERRTGGVYYTPEALAQRAVARVLGVRVEGPDSALDKIKAGWTPVVSDLSVGTGAFPIAMVKHLQAEGVTRARIIDIALALRLVDVDPYALELASMLIANEIREPDLAHEIRSNALHGNPLLIGEGATDEDRVTCFDQGFVVHRHLALPAVPDADIVLGNPPWERMRLEDKAFFRRFAPEVAAASTSTDRAALRDEALRLDPKLAEYYDEHREEIGAASSAIRSDHRFRHGASGELLTHALFTELAASVTARRRGLVGLLVKSTLLTSAGHGQLFRALADTGRLRESWGFTNARRLFPIDSRERFSFIILGPEENGDSGIAVASHLSDPRKLGESDVLTVVTRSDRYRLSPRTGLLPARIDGSRLRLLDKLSSAGVSFESVHPEAHFGRILHLTNHAEVIDTQESDEAIPVYEGRLVHQFDGRYATFTGVPRERLHRAKTAATRVAAREKRDPAFVPKSRYFVDSAAWDVISRSYPEPWSLVWRSASSFGNTHAVVATVLPKLPTIQSLQLLQLPGSDPVALLGLLGLFNSRVFDWSVRQRMGGIDVTASVIRDVPLPPPDRWTARLARDGRRLTAEQHVARLVAGLLGDDARLAGLCADVPSIRPIGHAPEDRASSLHAIDDIVQWAWQLDDVDVATLVRASETPATL